ncbi:MAG: hypothetical protein WAL75_25195 [Terracidiphilus sp.]
MTSKRLAFLCTASFLIFSSAYASRQLPDYPVKPASDYSIKVADAGAIVGVELVEDVGQQKKYFDTRLAPLGVLPVFMVVQNTSAADSIIFDRSALGLADPADLSGKKNRTIASKLGSGGLVDLSQLRDLTDGREYMMKNQIRSKTIAPGASVSGFVYVPIPRDQPRGKIHLQVPITSAQTGESTVLNLEF